MAESLWNQADVSHALIVLIDALKRNSSDAEWRRVLTPTEAIYNLAASRSYAGADLYVAYEQILSNALREHVLPQLKGITGIELLRAYVQQWNNYNHMTKWMQMMFKFLDRYHVKYNNLRSLREVAETCFHEIVQVAAKDQILISSQHLLLEPQHWSEVAFLHTVVVKLGVDENELISSVKCIAKDYYASIASEWLRADDICTYLYRVENLFAESVACVKQLEMPNKEYKIIRIMLLQLLCMNKIKLCDSSNIVNGELLNTITRLFSLVVPQDDNVLHSVAKVFKMYVSSLGQEVVEQTLKEERTTTQLLDDLLTLHDRYLDIVSRSFNGNKLFHSALQDAFEVIVNLNQRVSDALMSMIVKSSDEKTSELSPVVQDKIIELVQYVADRDAFANAYRRILARRLLNKHSNSYEVETHLVSQLTFRCGEAFTTKMQGMLNDLSSLRQDHILFSDHNLETCDFSVTVLTKAYWPVFTSYENIKLPPQMNECVKLFTSHYANTTAGRKLQWYHSLGNASMQASYSNNRVYNINVTTLQAVVIMSFNGIPVGKAVTLHDMEGITNIPIETLKRVLHSLSCGKWKMLKKSGDPRKIGINDTFSVNDNFCCDFRDIRLPEIDLENIHTPQHAKVDRSYAIDAAIVRIMKDRRTLSHEVLVRDVVAHHCYLYSPNVEVIKKRIESLIEREYLERDTESVSLYKYIA